MPCKTRGSESKPFSEQSRYLGDVGLGDNTLRLTLKALGFFSGPVKHWGRWVFSTPVCKIRSRRPRELKLTGLIAYIMLYKI